MKNKSLLFLIVILAIASFFRLYKLDYIPPGLYPDVAINGNEALESLKTKNFKVFYPENNGREGLMIWLIALSFLIFGVSIWSIKIVAAIIGILTVLGLYLFTKEVFQNTKYKILDTQSIALLSSFFLAISFWHTNFSRIGFRVILLPFVLVFSFYFLFRALRESRSSPEARFLFKGLRKKNIFNFIVAGIFFGLGFYTYTSFRVAVLILPFVLIPYFFIYRNPPVHTQENSQKKFLLSVLYFLLSTFIIALPIGIYFFKNQNDFIGRMTPISIFATKNPVEEFLKSLTLHLGMFNFYGDPNWRHNLASSPMLPLPVGILFLIGTFFSIKEFISSLKNKNSILNTPYLTLLSWFFIMLLPGILTYEGIPHALRTIGVIPIVYIFTGFGTWQIYYWINQKVNQKKLLLVSGFLLIVLIMLSEFNKYFCKWAKNPHVEGAFTKRFAEIGYYLNSLPPEIKKYVMVNQSGVPVPWPDGIPMPAQTVMFIETIKYGQTQSTYLLPTDLDKIKINEEPTVIVLMGDDKNLLNFLGQRFPQGKIIEKENIFGYEIR